MVRSHKICLDPNNAQLTALVRSVGCARFAWNWALEKWKSLYEAGLKPNEVALQRELNALKRDQFPWMYESPKRAPQQAIMNLGAAFKGFFEKRSKYPRFKKKGIHDSFRADNGPGTFELTERKIRLPKIGWIRIREPLRFQGKLLSAVVSRTASRWYVSIAVEIQDSPKTCENQAVVGVDLGIKTLATLSNGLRFEAPKPLARDLERLRRLSRKVSKKKKGSKNREKARMKLSRLHARIASVRKDALHKLTTLLVRQYGTVVIEDLNVRGMSSNGHLARAISDLGFYEFRRQLTYKAETAGVRVVVADRWYPSSKLCADCGANNEKLLLSDREWTCESCGTTHDRDLNAARNLMKLAASSAVTACGEKRSGAQTSKRVKRVSGKQEINTERGVPSIGSV